MKGEMMTFGNPVANLTEAVESIKKKGTAKAKKKKKASVKQGKDDSDQQYLGDMEPPTIKPLDTAIKKLGQTRNDLVAAKEAEATLLGKISNLMHQNNIDSYRGSGQTVTVIPGDEKIKVKPVKDR